MTLASVGSVSGQAPAGWCDGGPAGVGGGVSTSFPVVLCGKLLAAGRDKRLSCKVLI